MRSGKAENLPYQLSRWTDLPGARWEWFKEQLGQGSMVAFDQRDAMPDRWSLAPEDVLGFVFWTKNPANLIKDRDLILPHYKSVVHMTLTGWTEVELGAPTLYQGLDLMEKTVAAGFETTWRFSPIPMVEDVLDRFEAIAATVEGLGLKEVFVSFLQNNDRLPERRSDEVKFELLHAMSDCTNLRIKLCAEDRLTIPHTVAKGVCESAERFGASGPPPREGCGCAYSIDPFTVNESCTMGCLFCYAADTSLSRKKHNTTTARHLTVLP